MASRRRRTLLGFVGAVLVLAVLVALVGVDDLLTELATADPAWIGAVILAVLAWLVAWSVALRTVLGTLGVSLSVPRSFFVFSGAMFSNNVTPFGQAGGEPITALLIASLGDTEYETGLAAIASVDTLNVAPSITLALLGLGLHATEITFDRNLALVLGAFVLLSVAVPVTVYAAWRWREVLRQYAEDVLLSMLGWIDRRISSVSTPSPAAVRERVQGFVESIEQVTTDRRRLAVAFGFSTLGWICQMLGLWLAFRAVGVTIPTAIVMVAVPVAAVAGAAPLPGGAGGIEAVLVVVLVAATGPAVSVGAIAAAVVIFRGAVYWIPVVIGGGVVAVVSGRLRQRMRRV